jgi:hypothetical protein
MTWEGSELTLRPLSGCPVSIKLGHGMQEQLIQLCSVACHRCFPYSFVLTEGSRAGLAAVIAASSSNELCADGISWIWTLCVQWFPFSLLLQTLHVQAPRGELVANYGNIKRFSGVEIEGGTIAIARGGGEIANSVYTCICTSGKSMLSPTQGCRDGWEVLRH